MMERQGPGPQDYEPCEVCGTPKLKEDSKWAEGESVCWSCQRKKDYPYEVKGIHESNRCIFSGTVDCDDDECEGNIGCPSFETADGKELYLCKDDLSVPFER